jgi:protein tyrosine/serine phosphatase
MSYKWSSCLLGFVLLFSTILTARPVTKDSAETNIPNFQSVAGGLYRGGQPTAKGFEILKEKGVKTVINLRAEDSSESKQVQALGMRYVYIPVNAILPWSRIPQDSVAKYFELVNNPENYPIFFHCHRGADRTGVLAALYRIAVQHWEAQKAYEEARQLGMRWYFSGLKSQILTFHPPV